MPIPTIFIAIANDYYQGNRNLPELKTEASGLQTLLLEAENRKLCRFVIVHDATYQQVVQIFQQEQYRDTIAIFHFAGHAGSEALFLNTEKGESVATYRQGLVELLSNQRGLQLIFLNACFTERIADSLISGGIPAVVGTESAVLDSAASSLAIHFYRGLTRGLTIEEAWKDAKAIVLSAQDEVDPAAFYQPPLQREDMPLPGHRPQRFPWSMLIGAGKSLVKSWSLPTASRQLLFGLPDIVDRYDLDDEPFQYLRSYQEKNARNFFGRSDYIQKTYRHCLAKNAPPLLLFYGQSGVGKSSLLRAGILPRLQQSAKVVVLKRDPIQGLPQSIADALLNLSKSVVTSNNSDANDFGAVWRSIEVELQQPLVMIVDQAEELFTIPGSQANQELAQTMDFIVKIFGQKTDRPEGKLILSYRKEFHPEFEDAVATAGIYYHNIFIKRLNTEDIIEVVEGVAATPEHQAKYGVTIEAGLGSIIAADLLKDVHSPIAPVLQILLSKMWGNVKGNNTDKSFSLSLYHELQRQGVFLDDFYRDQMQELSRWSIAKSTEVVASGLALDVLYFHTTDFGTAKYRQFDEIAAQYHHQEGVLSALIMKLKDLYLLAGTDERHTTLAHDTLAPIVHQAIKESNLPGQRAYRLLEAKMADYEALPEGVTIEADDLAIVEAGRQGMRAWTTEEEVVIARSRKKRQRQTTAQRRTRQLLAILGATALILSLISTFAWLNNRNKAKGNEYLSRALQMEKVDPNQSLALVVAAGSYLTNDPVIQQLKHDIYSYQEFYDTIIALTGVPRDIAFGSGDSSIILAIDNEIQIWDAESLSLTERLTHNTNVQQIYFDDLTQSLFSASGSQINIWPSVDQVELLVEIPGGTDIREFTVSPQGNRILIGDLAGTVWLWQDDGARIDSVYEASTGLVTALAFSSTGDTLLLGDEWGWLRMFDKNGSTLREWQAHEDWITDIELDKQGNGILSGSRDKTTKLWYEEGKLLATCAGHEKRINQVHSLGERGWLTTSDDRQIKWWSVQGELMKSYVGHVDRVEKLAAVRSHDLFVSIGLDSTLIRWKLHTKSDKILSLARPYTISSFDLTSNGSLIAGTGLPRTDESDAWLEAEFLGFGPISELAEQPIFIWPPGESAPVMIQESHLGEVYSLVAAREGKVFASSGMDKAVKLWDEQGTLLSTYQHVDEIVGIAISTTGDAVSFTTADSLAVLWYPEQDKTVFLEHPEVDVTQVVFSPDSEYLYTAATDYIIRKFSVSSGKLLDEWTGHNNWITSLAISPDGANLISGDQDNRLVYWSTAGQQVWETVLEAQGKTGVMAIYHLCFSADGKRIAFTTQGGMTRVIDDRGMALQSHQNANLQPDVGLAFSQSSPYLLRVHENEIHYWRLLQ